MATRCYVVLSKRLVFFFSFKSGNTSLGGWIYEEVKPRVAKVAANVRDYRTYLNNPNMDITAKDGFDLVCNHGFKGVVLSRNPYARAVSAYVNKFIVDGERWITKYADLEPFAKKFLGGECENGISFVSYLEKIKNMRDKNIAVDLHFSPQIPKILIDKKFFEYQIKIENIDADLKNFCEKEGLVWREFPKLRTSKNAVKNVEGDLSCISSFALSKDKIQPNKGNLLSSAAIKLINEIYAMDFEKLNYEKIKI